MDNPFESVHTPRAMRLSSEQVVAVEAALTGPLGQQLIDLMRCVSLSESHAHVDSDVKSTARELGWLTPDDGETPLGQKVCDPLREFAMFIERDSRTHSWEQIDFLTPATFEGKCVLELGSSFGSNLFPLQAYAAEVIGVEFEDLYIQFTPVLAGLAGVEAPRMLACGADQVPLPDGYVDVILCFGALQYMPIERTLHETSRLLKPGGEALFALSHLAGYLGFMARNYRRWWAPKPLVREVITVAGMVLYPWIGRAFTQPHDPVYPTHRRMERWVEDAGLRIDWARTKILDHETNFVVVKDAP